MVQLFVFKQKTANEMRISAWSSDVCSSDLTDAGTGATAEAMFAIFLAREPRLPPRALAVLNRWQAFNVLWRQQWHPASEDERGTRIVAIVVSLVAHLFFAVFLLYVAYVRIMALPEEAASAGADVIQVEYIGGIGRANV